MDTTLEVHPLFEGDVDRWLMRRLRETLTARLKRAQPGDLLS